MSQIVKYACEALDNAEISCFIVKGDPWFKGIEVATVLGYARPRDAVYDHIPLKFKNRFQYLRGMVGVGKTPTLDAEYNNDRVTYWTVHNCKTCTWVSRCQAHVRRCCLSAEQ